MSKRIQQAQNDDKKVILTMWAAHATTRAIAQATGRSESNVLWYIRKALIEGECEERRIYHGKD